MVVAVDLPGHGFTGCPPMTQLSLPGMATGLAALLGTLPASPDLVAGHSAGAAILVRMCIDGSMAPRRVVSLNGAILPLHGLAGSVFSPIAKLFASASLVPRIFARQVRGDRAVTERLLRNTGSRIDARGADLYRRLASRSGHVGAALGMMAHWDLDALEADLASLPTPLVLVVGTEDRTIRPTEAYKLSGRVPGAELIRQPGLGHLAHEERPDETAAILLDLARRDGLLPDAERPTATEHGGRGRLAGTG
jgi:magnesium chelatase accessory protein